MFLLNSKNIVHEDLLLLTFLKGSKSILRAILIRRNLFLRNWGSGEGVSKVKPLNLNVKRRSGNVESFLSSFTNLNDSTKSGLCVFPKAELAKYEGIECVCTSASMDVCVGGRNYLNRKRYCMYCIVCNLDLICSTSNMFLLSHVVVSVGS